MISLTLCTGNREKELHFPKDSIYIGNFSEEADLFLPDETLSFSKVHILLDGSSYKIINLANDPFSSINGNPFGKADLLPGDILQIGETKIHFTVLPISAVKGEGGETFQENSLQNPFEDNEPISAQSSLKEQDELDLLFKQVEELLHQGTPAPMTSEAPQVSTSQENSASNIVEVAPVIVQDIVEEDRNVYEGKEKEPDGANDLEDQKSPTTTSGKFKVILISLSILITGLLVTMGFTFYEYSQKMIEEERKAARAITDITMALAYAKINHIKPSTQNWSSPDFLFHNLQGVLSKKYPATPGINSQSQIGNTSYILRIYTDSSLSRFLVIAQPGHNLSHWWIPKSVIAVDTKEMIIRKLKDLRGLNRLLTNPQPLDGKNGEYVFDLVKKGEIIPLASLASKRVNYGFTPPKALGMIRPGAENYLYNAPRYYPLTESIIKKSFLLRNRPETSLDVSLLLNDIESIAIFPDMVFYTSEGISQATNAQTLLKKLLPQQKLLIAYIKFNAKGKEVNNNLLITDESSKLSDKEDWKNTDQTTTLSSQSLLENVDHEVPVVPKDSKPRFKKPHDRPQKRDHLKGDLSHPLYQKLQELSRSREEDLRSPERKMTTLLAEHDKKIIIGFSLIFREALKEYEEVDRNQQLKILKELQKLYEEHSEVPSDKFMGYIETAGLGTLARDSLKKKEMNLGEAIISEKNVDTQIEKIVASEYLEELEHHVEQTFNMLTLSHLPNVEKLINFQNRVKYHVLKKLSNFILTPDKKLPPEAFHEEAEAILINILHKSWVFDPTEYHFFLNEFEISNSH